MSGGEVRGISTRTYKDNVKQAKHPPVPVPELEHDEIEFHFVVTPMTIAMADELLDDIVRLVEAANAHMGGGFVAGGSDEQVANSEHLAASLAPSARSTAVACALSSALVE